MHASGLPAHRDFFTPFFLPLQMFYRPGSILLHRRHTSLRRSIASRLDLAVVGTTCTLPNSSVEYSLNGSSRWTHADEPVALVRRVEHGAEPSGGELVAFVLARAGAVSIGLDETELPGGVTDVRDVDRSSTSFREASGVGDGNSDSAVLGACSV